MRHLLDEDTGGDPGLAALARMVAAARPPEPTPEARARVRLRLGGGSHLRSRGASPVVVALALLLLTAGAAAATTAGRPVVLVLREAVAAVRTALRGGAATRTAAARSMAASASASASAAAATAPSHPDPAAPPPSPSSPPRATCAAAPVPGLDAAPESDRGHRAPAHERTHRRGLRAQAAPPAPAPAPEAEGGTGDALVVAGVRALSREHDPERAMVLFDDYLARFPHGPLVEEAMAGAVEAAVAGGDGAWTRARAYVARFPRGQHRDRVQALIGPQAPLW